MTRSQDKVVGEGQGHFQRTYDREKSARCVLCSRDCSLTVESPNCHQGGHPRPNKASDCCASAVIEGIRGGGS